MNNIDFLKDKLKHLNNTKLEEAIMNSFNKHKIKGGSKNNDKEEFNEEDFKHEINFENNSDHSIEKFRTLREFSSRKQYINFNIIGKEEEKKVIINFGFFKFYLFIVIGIVICPFLSLLILPI